MVTNLIQVGFAFILSASCLVNVADRGGYSRLPTPPIQRSGLIDIQEITTYYNLSEWRERVIEREEQATCG